MKKAISITIISLCLLAQSCTGDKYVREGQISHVNDVFGIYTVEDSTGNMWEFQSPEGYFKGEKVTLKMNNNHTNTIYDDEIIKVKRER